MTDQPTANTDPLPTVNPSHVPDPDEVADYDDDVATKVAQAEK